MADLRWFRLEVDAAGKVLSCVAVERAEHNGRSWVYVQATDERAAHRIGLNAYMRDVMRKRRERLKAEGGCGWCGRKNDREPGKRCSICLAKESGYKQIQRDRAAGKPVASPDRKASVAAREVEKRTAAVAAAAPSLRLSVLLEVQSAWQDCTTNKSFTSWLEQQISKAGGVRRAG
jgi:hypothetical protein